MRLNIYILIFEIWLLLVYLNINRNKLNLLDVLLGITMFSFSISFNKFYSKSKIVI